MIEELNGLDELPQGWNRTQLGEIAEVVLGQSPPSSTYNEDGRGLPFYQGKLEFGKLYPTPRKWCTAPKKIAEKGDVLISVRAPVGPTNVCPEKSCIGRGLAAIRGLGGIGTLFILYLLRAFENEIARKGTGTTFSAISGDKLKELEIPLAPINEQGRIVAKLEELFTRLDAGVEELRKVKAQLKRYRQAALKAAINGDLTKEWRENHQDILLSESEFAQKIEKEKSSSKTATLIKKSQKFSHDTLNFEKLPKGWLYVPLIQAATLHRGYDLPEHKRINGPFPVVASSSIVGYHNEAKIKGPGVITGRSGTIGEVRYIESDFWPLNTSLYVCDFHNNNPKFISLLLQSMQIQKFLSGTGVPTLNRNNIHPLPVPLPQLPEQLEIVLRTEPLMSIIEQTALSIAKSMSQSERLRQSILMKAFRGELCTQDPNDESAEKLLERIKGERFNILKSNPGDQSELSRYVK